MRRASPTVVAVVVIALFATAVPARALDPHKAVTQYGQRVWRTEDGLPQNSVQAVVQTRDGYLWLGTQEGLVRFDGVRFTVFDKKTTDAIRNNNVQALWEGRDGSLWIGTGGGGLARLKDGVFRLYSKEQGLSNGSVWALLEDRAGTLWIATAGGGLEWLRDGRFSAYTTKDGLGSNNVLSLEQDRAGDVWAGTDGGGLARVRQGNLAVYRKADGLAGDTVYALRADRQGSLWIGTGSGLSRLKDGAFMSYTTKDGLAADRVESLVTDREGNLWVGTYGGGLSRLAEGRFANLTSKDGLSNDMVKALYEDEEGSLWIGTRTGGLNRLKDGRVTPYSPKEGLSNDFAWAIMEDKDGALWVGTDGGGVNRFQNDRFTTFTTKDGLSHNTVRSLVQSRDGALWIGTGGGGLNRFDKGKFTTFTTKDGLSHNFVRALYEDREGNLWIGTYNGGLNRLRDGAFTAYTQKDGLGAETVYSILEDRKGDLWIGTRGGGLSRMHDGALTTYTAKDGLSDEVVLALYEDARGALWIGTTGGLNRYKDGRFSAVRRKDGLFDDVAYVILEDGSGDLWMSCNKGIYRASKRELEDFLDGRAKGVSSVAYGKADGMRAAECNGGVQPAGWKTRDGKLWFPTIRGVAMIDPGGLKGSTRPPPVVIEQAMIDGSSVDPRSGAVAPPGRGELHFHYTALSFLAPERLRFKRKLEGFDADWVDAGGRREADYTNIPPGRYVFRVSACNEDGVWNETGAAFRFDLRPHLYQTAWFRGLCALAALAAGAGVYGLRVRQLKVRQKELQALVDERTKDFVVATRDLGRANGELHEAVRLKDEVVSIVAHDFRSPLTLIMGYGEILEERAPDEAARQMCAVINAQSRHLAALAADTLTMSRIETGSLPLEFRPVRLAGLVRAIVEARAAESGADVAVGAADDALVVEGDPDRLHQVVDNLVGNAVKYSPDGASVRVAVARTEEGAQVSVSDRGMGIAPEDVPRLFRRFSRLEAGRQRRISGTGLGLYICRSIIEAHGGRIWVESEEGRGSTFRFTIPAERTRPAATGARA